MSESERHVLRRNKAFWIAFTVMNERGLDPNASLAELLERDRSCDAENLMTLWSVRAYLDWRRGKRIAVIGGSPSETLARAQDTIQRPDFAEWLLDVAIDALERVAPGRSCT